MLRIYLDSLRSSEQVKLYFAERMAALERGGRLQLQPLQEPPVVLETPSSRHRRAGLILLLLGLSIIVALWEMEIPLGIVWWGLVPTAGGVAYLLSSFLEAREEQQQAAQSSVGSARRPDL